MSILGDVNFVIDDMFIKFEINDDKFDISCIFFVNSRRSLTFFKVRAVVRFV